MELELADLDVERLRDLDVAVLKRSTMELERTGDDGEPVDTDCCSTEEIDYGIGTVRGGGWEWWVRVGLQY